MEQRHCMCRNRTNVNPEPALPFECTKLVLTNYEHVLWPVGSRAEWGAAAGHEGAGGGGACMDGREEADRARGDGAPVARRRRHSALPTAHGEGATLSFALWQARPASCTLVQRLCLHTPCKQVWIVMHLFSCCAWASIIVRHCAVYVACTW
jgi:hypothetical protein